MPHRVSWLLPGLLALLGAGLLPAQTGTSGSGGIEEAQREFQALKSPSAVTDETRLSLPKIDEPQLPSVAPVPMTTPLSRQASRKAQRQAQKDKNWLVNAVMKDRTDGETDDSLLTDETDEAADDPFEQLIAEQAGARDRQNRQADKDPKAREQKEPEALARVPNPLADYITGWISPQDRALLLPTGYGDGSKPPAAGTLFSPGELPSGKASDFFAAPIQSAGFVDGANAGDLSVPPINPYLPVADSAPGLSGVAGFTPPPASSPPPPMNIPSLQSRPAAPAQSGNKPPPTVAKPDDAAKYFPQLKRF